MNIVIERMLDYKKGSLLGSFGRSAMIIAIGWLLSSCTGRLSKDYTSNVEQLGRHWAVNGKIGCHSIQAGGSLNFIWQQQGSAYKARLTIPLSRVQIQLSGSPTEFQLIDNKGRLYDTDEAQQYLKALGNINMPVTSLPYWLRGQPDPSSPSIANIDGLLQSGWRLSWPRAATGELPALLQLSSKLVSCRIALRHWRPLKAAGSGGIVQSFKSS